MASRLLDVASRGHLLSAARAAGRREEKQTLRRASSPLRPVHHPGNDFADRSEPIYSGPLARPDPLHHGVNRACLVLRDPDDEGREYRGPIPAVIGHGQPPWARGPRSPPARNQQPAIPWTGRTFSGGALVIRQWGTRKASRGPHPRASHIGIADETKLRRPCYYQPRCAGRSSSKRTILLTAICVKCTMPPLSAARPVRAGEVSND